MGRPRGFCLLLALGLLAACDAAPGPPAATEPAPARSEVPTPVARPFDYNFAPDSPYPMAYRTDAPLAWPPAKADAYSDVRLARPERHAITAPPARDGAALRPMVEWEPMQALVMQYLAYMQSAENATRTVLEVARHAAEVAEVWFIVESEDQRTFLEQALVENGMASETLAQQVRFVAFDEVETIWLIDFAPLPIVDPTDGAWAFADFRYYHERPLDDGVPTVLGRALPDLGLETPTVTYRLPLDLEGGTLQATSDGVCLTASRAIASVASDWSLETAPLEELQTHPVALQVESLLAEYLGCKDLVVTWSITDDGTGHLDMFLKVVSDDTILVGEYAPPFAHAAQQTNAARLDANAALLASYVKPDGGTFDVHRLVMPGHMASNRSSLPFTYLNSVIVNGLNLWPAYAQTSWEASRDLAASQWEAAAPELEHIWIDATELAFWGGAIHCITRTIPAGPPGLWVADGACDDEVCAAPSGGYDGTCQPGAEMFTADACWGPEWQCECNDCDGGCTGGAGPCGSLGLEGCCDGDRIVYCEHGASVADWLCPDGCGWVTSNRWYDCGGSGSDPANRFPRDCGAYFGGCEPDCTDRACGGDGCGGTCGSCNGDTICDAGRCALACTSTCDGKACGDDGCGAPCGTCAGDATCDDDGQCVPATDPPGPDVDAPDASCDTAAPDAQAPSASSSGCGAARTRGVWALAAWVSLALAAWRRRRRPTSTREAAHVW